MRSEIEIASEKWASLPGTSFSRLLALLREYAGLELLEDNEVYEGFFQPLRSFRLFSHHNKEVYQAIKDYYGQNGYLLNSPDCCNTVFLMNRVQNALNNKTLSPNGELQAILDLASNALQFEASLQLSKITFKLNPPGFFKFDLTKLLQKNDMERQIKTLVMGPLWKRIKEDFMQRVLTFSSLDFYLPQEMILAIALPLYLLYFKEAEKKYAQKIEFPTDAQQHLTRLGLFQRQEATHFYGQPVFQKANLEENKPALTL